MTGEVWVSCEDIHAMLFQLNQIHRKQLDAVRRSQEGPLTARFDRRAMLFMMACCRRVQHLITHEWHHFALETAEGYELDMEDHWRSGLIALRKGHEDAIRSGNPELDLAVCSATMPHEIWEATEHLLRYVSSILRDSSQSQARERNPLAEVSNPALLRDIFGNPFRPVAFDKAWRTGTAVALARQMYDAREFSAMPILADALQDAGCENADVLGHCRGPGPHVRGCWVVDLVLGKS
jgi:hypothetical protein